MKKLKNKKFLITTIMTIILIIIGSVAYAYLQSQIGPGATARITVDPKTVDELNFSNCGDISLKMTQFNFTDGGGNLSDSTCANIVLRANNSMNSATKSYNLQISISQNTFVYSTSPTNTPEILMTVTDPSGNSVTSITGLTYTTVKGVSGFDVTTKTGLIDIVNNYIINASPVTTHTWNITFTIINLDTNQADNAGKTFQAEVRLSKVSEYANLADGATINSKMKTVANNGTQVAYTAVDTNIAAIKRAAGLPSGFVPTAANTISTSDSTAPVYIWYEEDVCPVIMGDFNNDGNVNAVDKSVINDIIKGDIIPTDAQLLLSDANWDGFINVMDRAIFNKVLQPPRFYVGIPTYVDAGESNFYTVPINKGTIYFYTEADDIYLNSNSSYMFYNITYLSYIFDLSYFDTSNVTNMQSMFENCENVANIYALDSWNVSSVTNMESMFKGCAVTFLSPINHWNVSSVTNMQSMFYDNSFLYQLSSINGWDVTSVIYTANDSTHNNFWYMFYNSEETYPTFTHRSGTWDSNGTFIPST